MKIFETDNHQTVVSTDRTKVWLNIYCFEPGYREVMGTRHFDLSRSVTTPQWQTVLGINPVTGETDVYEFNRRWKK